MFRPEEWTKKWENVLGKVQFIYINETTGLPKLRSTFSLEQQQALDAYALSKQKLYYE